MERLIRDISGSQTLSQNFLESELDSVKESVYSFTTLVPKFRSTLRVRNLECLFSALTHTAGRNRTTIQSTAETKAEDVDR